MDSRLIVDDLDAENAVSAFDHLLFVSRQNELSAVGASAAKSEIGRGRMRKRSKSS